MRNKIKQIMNKEEGFTLVELLAVIVILGIIVAIAIPAIGNIVGRASTDADKAEFTLIEDAARLYDVENDFPDNNQVTVAELKRTGFLELRDSDIEDTDFVSKVSAGTGTDAGHTYEFSGR
ncbi:MAG: prepilin-type N-terminal cleavage/methylation domain-containing protein [Alkalibacterium sp.]|nr:prepilin-type N-terminal cleavage/methylation domain-containing protein [Alkalibacterium sp.]